MYSVWLTGDEQTMWRNHLRLNASLTTAMNRQLQQVCGMTLADYDVLVALSEGGRMRVNELGRALGWEQSRLSHQLRRMRERGLIRRTETADDGRGACVQLTASGRNQLRTAAPGHAELVRSVVFEPMTPAQARALGQWMSAVLERLDALEPR